MTAATYKSCTTLPLLRIEPNKNRQVMLSCTLQHQKEGAKIDTKRICGEDGTVTIRRKMRKKEKILLKVVLCRTRKYETHYQMDLIIIHPVAHLFLAFSNILCPSLCPMFPLFLIRFTLSSCPSGSSFIPYDVNMDVIR